MISVRNLHVRYPNSNEDILHDVSFDIAEGSVTAIMGANGSGKSSLVRALIGLLQPTSGTINVDELDVADASLLPQIRRKVGVVFQDPNTQMTSATIERELAFGLQNMRTSISEIEQKVERELQQLQFVERRLDFPSLLSGGEKQRLTLASVLLLNPKYLVLDEPTSFLSPSSRRTLFRSLRDQRTSRQCAIILITQFFSEALHAERLIVLQNGRIVFDNVPKEILQHQAPLESLVIPASSVSSQ